MVSYRGHRRRDGEGTTRLLWLSKEGNNVTQKIPTSLRNWRLPISIAFGIEHWDWSGFPGWQTGPLFSRLAFSHLHPGILQLGWHLSLTFQGYCYSSCPSTPLLKDKTSRSALPHRHISTTNDFDSFLQQRGTRESTIPSNLKVTLQNSEDLGITPTFYLSDHLQK